jgi:hypothetical protein
MGKLHSELWIVVSTKRAPLVKGIIRMEQSDQDIDVEQGAQD